MTDTELYIAFWGFGLIVFIWVGYKIASSIDKLTETLRKRP